jgi:hypothetical protein
MKFIKKYENISKELYHRNSFHIQLNKMHRLYGKGLKTCSDGSCCRAVALHPGHDQITLYITSKTKLFSKKCTNPSDNGLLIFVPIQCVPAIRP